MSIVPLQRSKCSTFKGSPFNYNSHHPGNNTGLVVLPLKRSMYAPKCKTYHLCRTLRSREIATAVTINLVSCISRVIISFSP